MALFTLSLTVGAMIVMWLGEQISLFGIGNGSSMLIFAGIVARFPANGAQLLTMNPLKALFAWQYLSLYRAVLSI